MLQNNDNLTEKNTVSRYIHMQNVSLYFQNNIDGMVL